MLSKRIANITPSATHAMTARIAAKRLDHTDFPSGYCLFEAFSPDEATDEVLDNALEFSCIYDYMVAGCNHNICLWVL